MRGERDGVLVVDDYAHNPQKVASRSQCRQEAYPDRRIVVLFQPQRYSRTLHLGDAFGCAFDEGDVDHRHRCLRRARGPDARCERTVRLRRHPGACSGRPTSMYVPRLSSRRVRRRSPAAGRRRPDAWRGRRDDGRLRGSSRCLPSADFTDRVSIARDRASLARAGHGAHHTERTARAVHDVPRRWTGRSCSSRPSRSMISCGRRAARRPPRPIVGRGSNLLVSDDGFRGIAVRLGRAFRDTRVEGVDVLRLGGAVHLPAAARTHGATRPDRFRVRGRDPGDVRRCGPDERRRARQIYRGRLVDR